MYLMKDASGSVIYVGKAINLPQRLKAYFCSNPQGTPKVLAMISHIASFEVIVCANELEALILENNLIKQYQPHYNILLKDDKEYPYIRVTMGDPYPLVQKSFHVGEDQKRGTRYFGPYQGGDLYRALQAIQEIFPLKRCKRQFPRDIGKERPCLYFHMGRCLGPCIPGEVTQEAYYEACQSLCDFLSGHSDDLLRRLKKEMQKASDQFEYEKAAQIRDRCQALEKLHQRQIIADPEKKDNVDVVGFSSNGSEAALEILKIREGRILSTGTYFFPDRGESRGDFLKAFILQYYAQQTEYPKSIILPEALDEEETLGEWLRDKAARRVHLVSPTRGGKKLWLEMAERNAKESLIRHTLNGSGEQDREKALEHLKDLLLLPTSIHRLEAYDIANYGEQDRAASMIVFEEGKPRRSAYRHFSIQHCEGQDDYASMAEVIQRRLEHLGEEAFGNRPQLILLDGAIGQIHAVEPILREKAPDIALAALIKDDRHRTKGLVRRDGRVFSFRPTPDQERKMSSEERQESLRMLRFLTAIQDEAHRFAGRQTRTLHRKRNLHWSLEAIPGVGESRRRALLKTFKSLKTLSEASLSEIQAVKGIPQATAQAIYLHFHPQEGQEQP